MVGWALNESVIPYVIGVSLYGVSRPATTTIHHAMVTELVERWRQETRTFDLPVAGCHLSAWVAY